MMTKKQLLFVLLMLPIFSWGQSRAVWMHHADNYYEKGDYHNALLNYKNALSDSSGLQSMIIPYEVSVSKQKLKNKEKSLDTTRVVPVKDYLAHQIAMCYMKTADYKKAVEHFAETQMFESYPEDVYYFATAQMNVDQYQPAIFNFQRYISSDHYDDSLLRSAQLSITGCHYAMDKNNVKKKVTVKLLDSTNFNKGTASFSPMFFGSEDKIMFASARDGGVIFDPEEQNSSFLCDLYWTEKKGSGWTQAQNFGRPLNSAQHDAAGTFNTQKNIIYYTRWNDENRKEQNIHMARMVDMMFYESYKLPASVNVEGYRSIHPFVSLDGQTLFFSSDRPGGEGGMDIWRIDLDENGLPTGEAENVGRPVNSELDEFSPFLHTASSTLFFSSNGHNSIGGLDNFKSAYNIEKETFGRPVNLGMPINSSKDDAYLIWDTMLEHGFFASDREDCENGHCYNIYEVTNEPIRIFLNGYAFDIETDEILPNTTLTFKDVEFKFENYTLTTDDKGYYEKELGKNQTIFIKATHEGYFADAASVTTKPITTTTTITQDFYLRPIPKDEIEIDGIEYDFNSDKLRPRSEEILDELYSFLEFNDNLIVEINSHTDFRGSDKYNEDLSQRRAKSCVDYLIKKGVDPERVIAKGYGEYQPNYLKDDKKKEVLDDEGNRIYLTEEYIKAESSEELREEYHQRNRRTSFKVVGEGFKLKSK